MKPIASLLAALALSACANSYPASSVNQGSQNAMIRVSAGGAGAQILIDGKQAGIRSEKASDLIETAPGRHTIVVLESGRRVVERDYFIGGGATVDVGVLR